MQCEKRKMGGAQLSSLMVRVSFPDHCLEMLASVGMHSRHLHNALADIVVQLASHILKMF